VGGAVAEVAVLQVEEDGGVAEAGADAVLLRRRGVGAEVDVGVFRPVIVLEVVDDRRAVQLPQRQGRDEAAVRDDDVGADIGPRLERLVGGLRVQGDVLEGAAVVLAAVRRAALDRVRDAGDAGDVPFPVREAKAQR
jgi:hypothetical protein